LSESLQNAIFSTIIINDIQPTKSILSWVFPQSTVYTNVTVIGEYLQLVYARTPHMVNNAMCSIVNLSMPRSGMQSKTYRRLQQQHQQQRYNRYVKVRANIKRSAPSHVQYIPTYTHNIITSWIAGWRLPRRIFFLSRILRRMVSLFSRVPGSAASVWLFRTRIILYNAIDFYYYCCRVSVFRDLFVFVF